MGRRNCSFILADQNRVPHLRAARTDEVLAIRRPGEARDQAVLKISDLFRWSAVKGLAPDVRDVAVGNREIDRFTVRRPLSDCLNSATRLKRKSIGGFATRERHDRNTVRGSEGI